MRWVGAERLRASGIYQRLAAYAGTSVAVKGLLATVEQECAAAVQQAKTVVRYMKDYTLHDGEHQLGVLELMERLIPPATLEGLSPLELALLILSAFYHDIGMAPAEEEVCAWLGQGESLAGEAGEREDFLAFCRGTAEYAERLVKNELDSSEWDAFLRRKLQDFIRQMHGIRGERMIRRRDLRYGNISFSDMLARICGSHVQDTESLWSSGGLDVARLVGDGQYVNEVFVAVVLRLADILDFSPGRAPEALLQRLAVHDETSLLEWAKHQAVGGWDVKPGRIAIDATCDHPAVEQALRRLIVDINKELVGCRRVLADMENGLRGRGLTSRYGLQLPEEVAPVAIRARTDDSGRPLYIYREIGFQLDQEKIVKLLMGTSLYGEAGVALRELLQNAIDTCRLAGVLHRRWGESYQPRIRVTLTHVDQGDLLEVWDNGMGMDWEVIEKYFTQVGRSYYQSVEFRKEAIPPSEFSPISKFGIGFLSAFMVAKKIEIETRRLIGPYQATEPLTLEVSDLWGIFWVRPGWRQSPGTTVRLYLKPGHPFVPEEGERGQHPLLAEVRRVAAHVEIPIEVQVEGSITRIVDEGFCCAGKAAEIAQLYDCIYLVPLDLADPGGLRGRVCCVLLEENGRFTNRVELDEVGRSVDGEYVKFTLALEATLNSIQEAADSLGMSDVGSFDLSTGYSTILTSQGRLAVKGIEVPFSLFADGSMSTRRYHLHKALLSWPITIEYDIDLSGEWELNLTATRDRVIMDGKWEAFKDRFTRLVAGALADYLGPRKTMELIRAVGRGRSNPFTAALVEAAEGNGVGA